MPFILCTKRVKHYIGKIFDKQKMAKFDDQSKSSLNGID